MKKFDYEWQRTQPDYVIYIPKGKEYVSDNEHIHVFDNPKEEGLIAIWTQSSVEGSGNNHAVISKSCDYGKTWTEPKYIVGSLREDKHYTSQASWAYPIVTKSGRIYLIYTRQTDKWDNGTQLTGEQSCIYSDDAGNTWTNPVDIPMRKTKYDSSDEGIAQNNVIFQKPIRGRDGKYICGYTKWTSYSICPEGKEWYEDDSRCFFMRFDNIDDDPEPKDIKITFLPDSEDGIEVPYKNISVAQEPNLILLPDNRLFVNCRTSSGAIYWSVSEDDGHTWSETKPLKFEDGSLFVHPLSPCPIYGKDGKYVQFYHNKTHAVVVTRDPVYISYGTFDPNGEQPIRFKKGEIFMDLEGVAYGPRPHAELALYGSFTEHDGKIILWYPDRKHFALGKIIDL